MSKSMVPWLLVNFPTWVFNYPGTLESLFRVNFSRGQSEIPCLIFTRNWRYWMKAEVVELRYSASSVFPQLESCSTLRLHALIFVHESGLMQSEWSRSSVIHASRYRFFTGNLVLRNSPYRMIKKETGIMATAMNASNELPQPIPRFWYICRPQSSWCVSRVARMTQGQIAYR